MSIVVFLIIRRFFKITNFKRYLTMLSFSLPIGSSMHKGRYDESSSGGFFGFESRTQRCTFHELGNIFSIIQPFYILTNQLELKNNAFLRAQFSIPLVAFGFLIFFLLPWLIGFCIFGSCVGNNSSTIFLITETYFWTSKYILYFVSTSPGVCFFISIFKPRSLATANGYLQELFWLLNVSLRRFSFSPPFLRCRRRLTEWQSFFSMAISSFHLYTNFCLLKYLVLRIVASQPATSCLREYGIISLIFREY